ncbi:MAG: hypothetical protein J0L96_08115 [Anaerolineae bacterium]|nr:hypothetical protein [Anaerolineae bacterium]
MIIKIKKIILQYIDSKSASNLVTILMILAIILMAGWVIIDPINPLQDPIWSALVLFIVSFLIGMIGIVYIYKKEMPGVVSSQTIRGRWAIFSGILLIVVFWGVGFLGLYFNILER